MVLASFMPEPRTQPLSERFANIISMMLGMLHAHGWRALFALPELIRAARVIRRLGDELVAMMKAYEAGTLLPSPTPAPWPEPPEWQAAPARPVAPPRPRAHPAAPRACRPRPQPAPAKPTRAVVHAHPLRILDPWTPAYPPSDILASGRST